MFSNLLTVSAVLSGVLSVLLAILLLLVMITVHEAGHYFAGKLLRFKINEFSIGFGPVLFQHTSKKSGEKFSVRLIPLGGYCAFAGEDELTDDDIAMLKSNALDDGFLDEKLTPPMPKVKNLAKPEKEPKNFCEQHPFKRIVVLLSGAFMNYLLALLVIFISFFCFGQLVLTTYQVAPAEGIASEYCFQDKDIILKADGKDVFLTTDLMNAVKDKQAGEKVEFYVSRIVNADTGERAEQSISVQLRRATDFENSADVDRLWEALGIAKKTNDKGEVVLNSQGSPTYLVYSTSYRFGFFKTIGNGFVYSFRIAGSIFQVLGELLRGVLGVDSLGGPVTTIGVTSKVLSRGVQPFFEIAAYIGVNLAVFNLLPIPALDGSKVVFTAIEWIRGKPIDRKIEAVIHAVGFLLLLGFAVFVDILQFL
ncbi:MAG: site-2 protease family protein [Clostridia bacterium]|nr:site-2 protease family protein [Clostridia bacterium]